MKRPRCNSTVGDCSKCGSLGNNCSKLSGVINPGDEGTNRLFPAECVRDGDVETQAIKIPITPKLISCWHEGRLNSGEKLCKRYSTQAESFNFADSRNGETVQDVSSSVNMTSSIAIAKRLLPDCWEALAKSIDEHRALNESPKEINQRIHDGNSKKLRQAGSYIANFCAETQGRNGNWYRSYMAATYSFILDASKRNTNPHFYEIVRDGFPCHLYFDLEYCKKANPSIEGNALVDRLLSRLDAYLWKYFSLALCDSCVLELDSSSSEKFSRHVVVRFENQAFKNSGQLKILVNHFLGTIEREDHEVLASGKQSGQETSFVDKAVYSRNRLFRCIWSSKGGEERRLVETSRYSLGGVKVGKDRIFELSLICNVDPSSKLLECDQLVDKGPQRKCQRLLDGQGNEDEAIHHSGPDSHHTCSVGKQFYVTSPRGRQVKVKIYEDADVPDSLLNEIVSEITRIENIAQNRGQGRAAYVNSICVGGNGKEYVSYSLLGPGSHFCENVGGFHKSNHVHICVNFITREYVQKCWDEACRSFQSTPNSMDI